MVCNCHKMCVPPHRPVLNEQQTYRRRQEMTSSFDNDAHSGMQYAGPGGGNRPSTTPRKRSSLVFDRRSRHYRKEGAAIGALAELTPSPPGLFLFVGGSLLGYGARLAYGCNIGAYFSGIASSSLHGWL
jgi:hypothetical protein